MFFPLFSSLEATFRLAATFAPEEIPRVFTRFYQASNIKRMRSGGIGVGLALVKAFTEGHGGKVYAESVVDSGSTFTVELPAAPEEFQGPAIQVPISA